MGESQDVDPRPISTADTDTRKSKRRKISNPQPGTRNHAHARLRNNRVRKTSGGKRLGPHPPRDLRRQTGEAKPDSGLSTPQGTSNGDPKFSLSFAKSILDKIWIRNKNQHRTQPWWKSLSMLRKAVSRLVLIEQEERSLRQVPMIGLQGAAAMDAKAVRKRFERETEIRGEKQVWVDWIRQVLVPKAYLGFSGLVSDTQFAHLGIVLVGLLADVVSNVGLPTPSQQQEEEVQQGVTRITATRGQSETATATAQARSLTARSTRVTGLQSGEVVERTYDSDDLGEVVERKRRSGTKREQEQEQKLSQATTTRPWPGRGTDRNPALGGNEDQALVAGPAADGVTGNDKTVRATQARRREKENPSSTAERPTAPSLSPSPSGSLPTSQRDPPTICQDSGAAPPPSLLPRHPPVPRSGKTSVLKDPQKQTTSPIAETHARKETRDNKPKPKPKRDGTTKGKDKGKGKGKGKGKSAIDDLFAGLT